MRARTGAILAAIAVMVLIAAIAAGLAIVGSPAAARRLQADRTRVDQLRQIARGVNLHWTRHHAVPASLEEIAEDRPGMLPRADPEGGTYEFRALDDDSFELCARFEEPSGPSAQGDFWQHGAGRQCYVVNAHVVRP